jgi:hypothetical protein
MNVPNSLQNNSMGLIIISISILFSVFGVFLFKGKMVLKIKCGIKLFFKIISVSVWNLKVINNFVFKVLLIMSQNIQEDLVHSFHDGTFLLVIYFPKQLSGVFIG